MAVPCYCGAMEVFSNVLSFKCCDCCKDLCWVVAMSVELFSILTFSQPGSHACILECSIGL